jgi:hypothetical protein
MWVKKGTVVGGKKVKKGYVAQKGKAEKRVTARIKLEEATRRGKVGDVAVYKSGRYKKTVGKGRVDRNKTTAGGGVTKAQAAAQRRAASGATTTPPPPKVTRKGFSSSAANRGGYSAAGYIKRLKPTSGGLAGSGKDNVNAATSGGSAKTSNYKNVTDSLMSTPVSTDWGAARPEPATANRPSQFRGKKTRLAKSGGQLRWVKVGK